MLADPGNPARALDAPGLSAILYWLVLAALAALLAVAAWCSRWLIACTRHKTSPDPRRLAGVATVRDVATSASERALLARGRTLRPSMANPKASDVGYLLGRSRGKGVWASVEDSTLLLGPPRSGKGLHVVINAILDAPGAVITTSTRPDDIAATVTARERRGPVACLGRINRPRSHTGWPAGRPELNERQPPSLISLTIDFELRVSSASGAWLSWSRRARQSGMKPSMRETKRSPWPRSRRCVSSWTTMYSRQRGFFLASSGLSQTLREWAMQVPHLVFMRRTTILSTSPPTMGCQGRARCHRAPDRCGVR